MNASELVAWSFYLSDVVSRNFETVSGSQHADGLTMLNDLLNEKAAKGNMIPYYTHSTFNAVIGQEEYDITGLMELSALTFINGTVRYPMTERKRKNYFGRLRTNDITGWPSVYNFERKLGGARIYTYFLPQEDYTFEITGKFFLTNVTSCTDLTTLLDGFYIAYLKSALAERIADFYSVEFSASKRKTLIELENKLFEIDPPDMTINKISALTPRQGIDWAAINLYKGLWP